MEKQLVGAIVLVMCMLAAGPYSGLAHKSCKKRASSKPCGPGSVSFYMHNLEYNAKVNNTGYFNSVYGPPPPPLTSTFFGAMAAFEDPLTADRANNSQQIGVAQGLYVIDGKTDFTLFYVFTANISTGEHQGTLSIMGQERLLHPVSYLTVTGGTGDFAGAHGVATSTFLDLDSTPPARWTFSFDIDLHYH